MTDTLSPSARSAQMALVRSSGTGIESALLEIVRKALGRKTRIERHVSGLPGSPDVVIPSLRVAIFVHGCFWHKCPIHARLPKSRREFWAAKFDANVKRDRSVNRALRAKGWAVWVLWEHDLTKKTVDRTTSMLRRRFEKRRATAA